ncbi:hypothetical protein ETB97_000714 [Aspergillus alliaceus]|uniref:Uncharacterized protein n=1 Tax=Petromyces alliaceus TaxID=209559 RepID=A0A8H6AGG3_PETAA|nr:hypothetical protein ETB97_000714 [Aspergillus burnettii]
MEGEVLCKWLKRPYDEFALRMTAIDEDVSTSGDPGDEEEQEGSSSARTRKSDLFLSNTGKIFRGVRYHLARHRLRKV